MISKSEALFEKYKKQLLIGLAAVVVVVGGVFAYRELVSGPREAEASTAMARGQEYFGREQFEQALNGDSTGYKGFAKIAADYSGTAAGNLANLYAGLCYANLDKWAEAEASLAKYDPAGDAMVSPAAVAALGNAYAHTGKVAEAAEALKKAAAMADKQAAEGVNNSIAPVFLVQAARLLESQGKAAEALAIYKDIKAKRAASQMVQAKEIDKYIEKLERK